MARLTRLVWYAVMPDDIALWLDPVAMAEYALHVVLLHQRFKLPSMKLFHMITIPLHKGVRTK